jgi:DNA-binding transcriptional LysR family regulator
LSTTQPALSRTLRSLEGAVGVRLVDRTTTSLALSPSGRAMLPRAEAALAAVEEALDVARHATWPLRVGYAWSAAGLRTARLVRSWNAAHPEAPVEFVQVDDRYAGLARGLVDVAVLRGIEAPDGADCAVLDCEARVAVLAADHRLAAAPSLVMADLADERLVVNEVFGTVTPALWPEQARPRTGTRVRSMESWLLAIAVGQGVGVSAASTAQIHARPDVVYVPLLDAPPMAVTIAWRRRDGHAAREEFARTAIEVVGGVNS